MSTLLESQLTAATPINGAIAIWGVPGSASFGQDAQTFIPSRSYKVDYISLLARLYGATALPSSVVFEIQTIVAGKPDGVSLGSGQALATTIWTDSSWAWGIITSDTRPTVISGIDYAMVLHGTAGSSLGSYLDLACVSDGTYTTGSAIRNYNIGGGVVDWTNPIADATCPEYHFKLYGSVFNAPNTAALPGDKARSNKLVVIGYDQVYSEAPAGTMAEITAARNILDCANPIDLIPAYQKVFVVNNTNMKVIDFTNSRCFTTNVGTNPPDYNTQLTGGTSGGVMVVDYINALTTQTYIYGCMINSVPFLTTDTVTGTDDDGNAISFAAASVLAASSVPLWYNWTVWGGSTTYGTLPSQPGIGCLYRGRVVLAGKAYDTHQWEMSRQGNPWDWNYISNDSQSPIAGNNADVGKVGDSVIALIPRKDDFLIFGCANSMWLLRGDAAEGGSLDPLTLTTGIFGKKSWCWDDNDNLYWWGNSGIFKLSNQGTIENITRFSLPEIIRDIGPDPTLHIITMGFDSRKHGIVICITKVSDKTNNNFWFDLRTNGMFPESYPVAVTCQHFYNSDDDARRELLVGCSDGYIRYFDIASKNDDTGSTDTAISSYVVLGPYPFNSVPGVEGKLLNSFVTLGGGASGGVMGDTDGLQLSYYTGDDAETLLEDIIDGATPFLTVAFTGTGRKTKTRTKMTGVYGAIKCSSVASDQTWAIENIVGEIKPTRGEV